MFILFSIVTISLLLVNYFLKKNNIFCLSNLLLLVFSLIFVISPIVIGGNGIVFNDKLLFFLLIGYLVMFVMLQQTNSVSNFRYFINFKNLRFDIILNIYIATFLGLVMFHFFTGAYFSVLSSNRGAERLESYYEDNFDLLKTLKSYFKVFFLILLAYFPKTRINNLKVLLVFVLFAIEVVANSQHRTPVITPILLAVIYFHFYLKKISVIYFIVISFGVILFMSMAAYIRVGEFYEKESISLNSQIAHGLRGLNTSENFNDLYEFFDSRGLELEYGYQLYLEILTPVPRMIWKDKPNVSFSSRMTEVMYGKISSSVWVRTFTVWAEGFVQFGYFGIILYSFLLVFMLKNTFLFLSKFFGFEFVLINFMLSLPFYVRTDFFAVYARILDIFVVLMFLIIFFKIKKGFVYQDNGICNSIIK